MVDDFSYYCNTMSYTDFFFVKSACIILNALHHIFTWNKRASVRSAHSHRSNPTAAPNQKNISNWDGPHSASTNHSLRISSSVCRLDAAAVNHLPKQKVSRNSPLSSHKPPIHPTQGQTSSTSGVKMWSAEANCHAVCSVSSGNTNSNRLNCKKRWFYHTEV